MPNVFEPEVTAQLVARIRSLEADRKPEWGRMDVAQMLAHCCVPYEFAFENIHREPGPVVRWLLRVFVKPAVVGNRPYRRNLRTAPAFRIVDDREFQRERDRLIGYVERAGELGEEWFEGRTYPSFGRLSAQEWSNLFHKHLDHHLTQFGA